MTPTTTTTWINLTPVKSQFLRGELAIRLYPPETQLMAISLAAWRALGEPRSVCLYYDPLRHVLALQATESGYKLHLIDAHQTGTPNAITMAGAGKLRKLCAQHGHGWPSRATEVPLTRDGELLLAHLPLLDAPASAPRLPFLEVGA